MSPNLVQARRTWSWLLPDPFEVTPVSSWIWVAKSIPGSMGIVQNLNTRSGLCPNAERVVTCKEIDSSSEP